MRTKGVNFHQKKNKGMCRRLNKALYGTRDAAQNWEHEYIEFLESIGFTRRKATPCIFRHEERLIFIVFHGDDFTVLGKGWDLDWLRLQIDTTPRSQPELLTMYKNRLGAHFDFQAAQRVAQAL